MTDIQESMKLCQLLVRHHGEFDSLTQDQMTLIRGLPSRRPGAPVCGRISSVPLTIKPLPTGTLPLRNVMLL